MMTAHLKQVVHCSHCPLGRGSSMTMLLLQTLYWEASRLTCMRLEMTLARDPTLEPTYSA